MEANHGVSIDLVWSLATGGSNVAADPAMSLPESAMGPPAAGVAESSEWLTTALNSSESAQHFLFFVGGPGGGKSQAAAQLVRNLPEIDPRDPNLAYRSYRYRTAGRPLTLINDATIATGEDGIVQDIQGAITRGDHLLVCINRGILADATTEDESSMGDVLTHWLGGSKVRSGDLVVKQERGFLWLSEFNTSQSDEPVQVCAVFVDNCSLLEKRPGVKLGPNGLDPGRYEISQFRAAKRDETPAGMLMQRVVANLVWDSPLTEHVDPIRANLTALRSTSVLASHLQLLRAAEITNGERLTYREVWGATCRLLFGDLPLHMTARDADEYLTDHNPDEASNVRERFRALQDLANLRSFIGLFGGLGPRERSSGQDPVLRFTSAADPLLDARPGRLATDQAGWASPVLDAFSSTALGGSPLESLEREIPEDQQEIIQPFDRTVDLVFREFTDSASASDRTSATAWYGRYLTRLYAAAEGVAAFQEVITQWTSAWRRSPGLPDLLRGPLRTLLNPRRDPSKRESNPVIPVYASRTEPILGFVSDPTLALRADTFQFDTRRDGEALHLAVKEEGTPIGTVLLDFDLLREAMTCSDDWLGLTEAREKTEPRVERFRSRRLISSHMQGAAKLAIQYDLLDEQLSLGEW